LNKTVEIERNESEEEVEVPVKSNDLQFIENSTPYKQAEHNNIALQIQ
jgi:hypothetical protein